MSGCGFSPVLYLVPIDRCAGNLQYTRVGVRNSAAVELYKSSELQ